MNNKLNNFVNKYVREIKENNAIVFIGAGFSKSAGYVDWKKLLTPIAEELELNIDKESDFVKLTQYYRNKKQNRSEINNLILEEFSGEKEISLNHKILARLPISTYWTTNYDSLIEDALTSENKIVDVKYNNAHLSLTIPHRKAIIYKMHGDKSQPNDAVIIKDDYDRYHKDHAPFITALNGDLISKTVLFIGFSFSDPNIDYILSRIRVEYGEGNSRQHYALMKRISKSDIKGENTDFEYAKLKQSLFINDLMRYNIEVLLIDDYSEITDVLKEIEKQMNLNNIFISGSAEDYGLWKEKEAKLFIHKLCDKLIQGKYNIISGFGVGVGSFVITGVLESIYLKSKTINTDRLILHPFPQGIESADNRQKLWSIYRNNMISKASISIFMFGNKIDTITGDIVCASGVEAEFEIANEHKNLIVPIGCTGFVAEKIWNEINKNMVSFYPMVDDELIEVFCSLNELTDYKDLIDDIVRFIELLRRKP